MFKISSLDEQEIINFALFRVRLALRIKKLLEAENVFITEERLDTIASESILTILKKKRKI